MLRAAVVLALTVCLHVCHDAYFTAEAFANGVAKRHGCTQRSSFGTKMADSSSSAHMTLWSTTTSTSPDKVKILPDAAAVSESIRQIVQQAAEKAIAERGSFALAIPGGSILKMLVGSGGASWTAHTTLVYVNHKCVPMDDANLATHAKARKLFLDKEWPGCKPILLEGTSDGTVEALAYSAKMHALDPSVLPVVDGWPVFDLVLIGVGDDGHIGSLYPSRPEVLDTSGDWVLPVDMKSPPSITLSLPVMTAAKQVVVAACGVSDKYPQGKSQGMYQAIESTDETLSTFPAVGLRSVATWFIDEAAGSKLGASYRAN